MNSWLENITFIKIHFTQASQKIEGWRKSFNKLRMWTCIHKFNFHWEWLLGFRTKL